MEGRGGVTRTRRRTTAGLLRNRAAASCTADAERGRQHRRHSWHRRSQQPVSTKARTRGGGWRSGWRCPTAAKQSEFYSLGLVLGYEYPLSPIVWSEQGTAPAALISDFTPSAHPGARLPHAWLAEGRLIYDLLGAEFSIVSFGVSSAPFLAAAVRRGVSMTPVISLHGRICVSGTALSWCWSFRTGTLRGEAATRPVPDRFLGRALGDCHVAHLNRASRLCDASVWSIDESPCSRAGASSPRDSGTDRASRTAPSRRPARARARQRPVDTIAATERTSREHSRRQHCRAPALRTQSVQRSECAQSEIPRHQERHQVHFHPNAETEQRGAHERAERQGVPAEDHQARDWPKQRGDRHVGREHGIHDVAGRYPADDSAMPAAAMVSAAADVGVPLSVSRRTTSTSAPLTATVMRKKAMASVQYAGAEWPPKTSHPPETCGLPCCVGGFGEPEQHRQECDTRISAPTPTFEVRPPRSPSIGR